MATQLSKGVVFNPGDIVDAADLNNLVDEAVARAAGGLITEQVALATAIDQTHDLALIYDDSAGGLRKCLISALPSGVTSIGLTVTPTTVFESPGPSPITTTGTFSVGLKDQAKNKVLAGPSTGANATPSFRILSSADLAPDTVLIAAYLIDWSLGNLFVKTLPPTGGPFTFTFSNVKNGQTIKVRIRQRSAGTGRANWDADPLTLIWNEGTEPEVTTVANGYSMFVFTAVTEAGVTRIHGYLERESDILFADEPANTFYAGPASGADDSPTFRAITPADTSALVGIGNGSFVIDCRLGNVFDKFLEAGNNPMRINNGVAGQRISVYLQQNAGPSYSSTVGWGTTDGGGVIRWPGGTDHVMTTGINKADIINFLCLGSGNYYGTFNLDFLP